MYSLLKKVNTLRKREEKQKMKKAKNLEKRKHKLNLQDVISKGEQKGITLIALVITILFSYDEKLKCSNSKGFLLQTI